MKKKEGKLKILLFMIVSLLLTSLVGNGYFIFRDIKNMTVPAVHDGDTFTLGNGQRVKLLGVDAPELTQCQGKEATESLQKLVLGKIVTIKEEKRDTYGRRMGLVYVGKTLINEKMLSEGFGKPDYTKNTKSELLKSAYAKAKTEKLGIHSGICGPDSLIPDDPNCVIKGNIDQTTWKKLYHLPSCRHYDDIIFNHIEERFFCTEEEAQDAGFTLAPDCER